MRRELLSIREQDCWSNGVVSLVGVSRIKPSSSKIKLAVDTPDELAKEIEESFRRMYDSWLGRERKNLDRLRQILDRDTERILIRSLMPWRGKTSREMWSLILTYRGIIGESMTSEQTTDAQLNWQRIDKDILAIKRTMKKGHEQDHRRELTGILRRITLFDLRYMDLETRTREMIEKAAREYREAAPPLPIIVVDLGSLDGRLF